MWQLQTHLISLLSVPAFDSVDRNALWKALRARGIPDTLLHLIEDIHTHTGATVRIGNKFSRRFATTSGVRQRCVLAPALFLVAIDWILNHLAPDVGTTVGQRHFTDLTYADDAAIFMCDVTQAASTLQSFNTIAASLGLRISWAKTKLHNVGAGNPPTTLFLDGAPVEGVEEFIYLVSKQSSSGYCRPDMLRFVKLTVYTVSHKNVIFLFLA